MVAIDTQVAAGLGVVGTAIGAFLLRQWELGRIAKKNGNGSDHETLARIETATTATPDKMTKLLANVEELVALARQRR